MANKLIPELRFLEFTSDWEEKKLGEKRFFIIDGDRGKNYPNGNDFSNEGYCLFLNAKNVTKNGFSFKTKSFITKEKDDLLRKGKLERFDIILTTRGSVGHFSFYDENISYNHLRINSGMVIIRNNTEINTKYLFKYLNSNQIQNRVKVIAFGSAQPQLTVKEISKLKIKFPTIIEQTKIATFLTAVDKRINLLQKKKVALEQYKKGLMQKLFSVKTDGNPSLRFKKEDGSDFEDWDEKRYSDIYTFYSTNSLSRDKLNYKSGITKNIHYGDIHTKFSTLFDIERESVPFINEDVNLNRIKDDNYLKKGDLLIADASEDYDDIGKTVEVVNLNEEKVISGLHTFHARPNKFKMAIGFSGYLLQNWYIRKQVMKIAQGTKVLSISTGRLGEIKLTIPSFEEQQKITGFLSSIDTSIENITKQIDDSVVFKKGLFQKMFV